MGAKLKSQAKNIQVKIPYKKRGLLFESMEAYEELKNIDTNANQLVDAIKSGSLDMKEFFSGFNTVKVKETYTEASENLDVLFENITRLSYIKDRDYFKTELDFSDSFYSLIDIDFFDN